MDRKVKELQARRLRFWSELTAPQGRQFAQLKKAESAAHRVKKKGGSSTNCSLVQKWGNTSNGALGRGTREEVTRVGHWRMSRHKVEGRAKSRMASS